MTMQSCPSDILDLIARNLTPELPSKITRTYSFKNSNSDLVNLSLTCQALAQATQSSRFNVVLLGTDEKRYSALQQLVESNATLLSRTACLIMDDAHSSDADLQWMVTRLQVLHYLPSVHTLVFWDMHQAGLNRPTNTYWELFRLLPLVRHVQIDGLALQLLPSGSFLGFHRLFPSFETFSCTVVSLEDEELEQSLEATDAEAPRTSILKELDLRVVPPDPEEADFFEPSFQHALASLIHEWTGSGYLTGLESLTVDLPDTEPVSALIEACSATVTELNAAWHIEGQWSSSAPTPPFPWRTTTIAGHPHTKFPHLRRLTVSQLQNMTLASLADMIDGLLSRCDLRDELDVTLSGDWDDANALEDYFCLMDDTLDSEWERLDAVLMQCPIVTLNVEAWADSVILNMPLAESEEDYMNKLPGCTEQGNIVVALVYKVHRATVDEEDGYYDEILGMAPVEYVRIVGY